MEIWLWLCVGLIAYAYLGYPLLLAILSRLAARRLSFRGPVPREVAVVVAAHNEGERIERRLDELTELMAASSLDGEIIVVSDGSTDNTAALARAHSARFGCGGRRLGCAVHVLELPAKGGKAAAVSAGCAVATRPIIVFADTRQAWDPNALTRLLENFADAKVGAVSGELIVGTEPGLLSGVGLYWGYEKWIRVQESRLHSTVGVTGAISAVRQELFRPIPAGTILDDVYWPLQVAMQGYRVVHDRQARAYDRLPERPGDEFRRKVRTLSGNFQLLTRLPAALLPWRNPVWFQFFSHKLLRLAVPWALLAL